MHSYTAFGLRIQSEIEFAGFTRGVGSLEPPDITVRRAEDLEEGPLPSGERRGGVMGGRIVSEEEGVDLLFFLDSGERVYFRPLTAMDPVVLRGFVQGPLLAGALRQRHLLTLHGSAISDGERAVVFLGHSGWGKSTLATYFCQRGYGLLTDDLMVIHPGSEEEPATVPPGVKQVRLRPAAAEHLVEGHEALPVLDTFSLRRVHVLDGETRRAIPLEKIYVLQPQTAEENRVVPLGSHLAPMHLVAHTHSMNWITAPDYAAEHLRRCTQLARYTPIALLERKLSLDQLPALFDVVQEDLAAVRAGEPEPEAPDALHGS